MHSRVGKSRVRRKQIDQYKLEQRQYNRELKLENWKRVWQCRDFELSHLWQRSIFLTAFLILIYTGYGTFMIELLKPLVVGKCIIYPPLQPNHHIIAIGMCALGIIFSLLWIMMGKGSKYWYECYESKINELEEENKYLNANNVGHLMKKNSNHCIWSTKGGKFSVSSINILIGQVSLVVWILLFIVHTLFMIVQILLGWDEFTQICEKCIEWISNNSYLFGVFALIISIGICWMFCKLGVEKLPFYKEVYRKHNKSYYLYELHDMFEQHLEEIERDNERKKIKKDLNDLIESYANLYECADIDKDKWKEMLFWTTTEKDLKKYERKFKTLKTKFEELTQSNDK